MQIESYIVHIINIAAPVWVPLFCLEDLHICEDRFCGTGVTVFRGGFL